MALKVTFIIWAICVLFLRYVKGLKPEPLNGHLLEILWIQSAKLLF